MVGFCFSAPYSRPGTIFCEDLRLAVEWPVSNALLQGWGAEQNRRLPELLEEKEMLCGETQASDSPNPPDEGVGVGKGRLALLQA